MNKIVYDLLLKLEQCDDRHNRCDYLMEHDEITYLLDYITNLQKEKERIKKDVKKIQYMLVEVNALCDEYVEKYKKLQEENEKVHKELDYADNYNIYLISRIDKAIEYIKKTDTFQLVHSVNGAMEALRKKTKKDLLNILQGSDKE